MSAAMRDCWLGAATVSSGNPVARLSWPLPIWLTALPGAAFCALSFWVVWGASKWVYVPGGLLSGMARQAVMLTGVIACVAAAFVSAVYSDRRAPYSLPILKRAAGPLGVRLLGVVLAWWCLGEMLGSVAATALQFARATGGRIYCSELVIAAIGFAAFIVMGFAVGTVVSRWYA